MWHTCVVPWCPKVKPRISLRNPEQYLEQHALRKRQQDAARQEQLQVGRGRGTPGPRPGPACALCYAGSFSAVPSLRAQRTQQVALDSR